jgi:hypothetical protein
MTAFSGRVNTEIFLNKGDLYSIMIDKEIILFRGDRDRGILSKSFKKWIGQEYQGPVFSTESGGTYFCHESGQLYLGIQESLNINQNWFFDVIVVVWNTKEWSLIAEFVEKLKEKSQTNFGLRDAYEEAKTRDRLEITKKSTSEEIDSTIGQIEILKKKDIPQSAISSSEHQGDLQALEARLSELSKKKAYFDDLTQLLEQQRLKVSQLNLALEESARREKELMVKISEGAKLPPILLITAPYDGFQTESEKIRLTGAVRDDWGVVRLEIFVNGQPAEEEEARAIKPFSGQAPREANFERIVPLASGANHIIVRATSANNLTAERSLNVSSIPTRRNVFALVVGINSYPQLPQLKYAVNDARAFYRVLIENAHIPADNITLLLNEQATLRNLRSLLGTRLKEAAGVDDTVIIYFAGHRATDRDAASPDGDGLEKYILAFDSDPTDLFSSALPMRDIALVFNRIRSERLIFIIDSCYSGATGGRTVSITGVRANIADNFLERIAGGKGKVILTASAANEVSAEKDDLQHGVFTYYLLAGLRGAADSDKDGVITVDEAYRYLSDQVPKATAQEQHPVKKGAVEGNLVLSTVR